MKTILDVRIVREQRETPPHEYLRYSLDVFDAPDNHVECLGLPISRLRTRRSRPPSRSILRSASAYGTRRA